MKQISLQSNRNELAEELSIYASPNALRKLVTLPALATQLFKSTVAPKTQYDQLLALAQYDSALICRYLMVLQHKFQFDKEKSLCDRLAQGDAHLLKSTILCSASFASQFSEQWHLNAHDAIAQHWLESLQCALLCKALARLKGLENYQDFYYAGLLYRVGDLSITCQEQRNDQALANHAGKNELLSGKILNTLNLPAPFQDAAQHCYFELPAIAGTHPMTQILHAAHTIVSGGVSSFREAKQLIRAITSNRDVQLEALVESAINQSNEIQDSLQIAINSHVVRQKLLPPLPDPEHSKPLGVILEQNYQLQRQQKTLLSVSQLLQADESIQTRLNTMANLLFGCEKLVLFNLDEQENLLRGSNNHNTAAQENAVCIPLKSDSVLCRCIETKNILLHTPETRPVSVIDRELLGLAKGPCLIALPIESGTTLWGCALMAFDTEVETQFNSMKSLLHSFSEQAFQLLESQDQRQHERAQQLQSERKLSHQRIKRVIHEVNNPLSIALNHLHLVQLETQLPAEARNHIEICMEQIQSSSDALFHKIDKLEAQKKNQYAVNINELVSDVSLLFKLEEDSALTWSLQLDESTPAIYIDDIYLQQILINLIKNAVESVNGDGCITISTCHNLIIRGQTHIAISIQDDGPGIKESMLPELFNSKRGTKKGKHRGMGLAIVSEMVDELGGMVSYERKDNMFSVFTLYLPKYEEPQL